jgi:hypothetical protein
MQESVLYAATKEGFALPVLDVSNPRFAVPEDPGSLSRLHQAFLESERQRRLIPRFVMRWMLNRHPGDRGCLQRSSAPMRPISTASPPM